MRPPHLSQVWLNTSTTSKAPDIFVNLVNQAANIKILKSLSVSGQRRSVAHLEWPVLHLHFSWDVPRQANDYMPSLLITDFTASRRGVRRRLSIWCYFCCCSSPDLHSDPILHTTTDSVAPAPGASLHCPTFHTWRAWGPKRASPWPSRHGRIARSRCRHQLCYYESLHAGKISARNSQFVGFYQTEHAAAKRKVRVPVTQMES